MGSFFRFVFQVAITVVLVAWMVGLPALSGLGSVHVKTIGAWSEGTFGLVLVYQTSSVTTQTETASVIDSALRPRPGNSVIPRNANRIVLPPEPRHVPVSNQREAGELVAQ